MTRRKSVCSMWTLVLLVVIVCPSVYSRPQEISVTNIQKESTQAPIRDESARPVSSSSEQPSQLASPAPESSSRDVKTKAPIRESIEMVAIQLLDKPNSTVETPIVADTRIPPKLKTQVKHKIKTRNEDGDQYENAHPGEAVPVTMEELDTENKINEVHESSTSNEGISTWVSLSNSVKENTTTEPTKVEDSSKKPKPAMKNKPKRPQNNKPPKRPIIGSTNKADLVAGGSAINENVFNKLKDTVLTNVQKNKNTSVRPITTTTTTTTTEAPTTKKETKTPAIPVVTVTSKPKKKNKNKNKTTTTLATPIIDDSALLPTEAKEQEIELEVSTPPTTTKKPKRSSNREKNKTKKRKTSTPKPDTDVAIVDVKTANKTKTNKNAKKPAVQTGAITTQIYNYLSREVMPSVGVGMLGLASLVGIAGYFLYPFATPVRRTFEVDKSDDLYRNNAEEYANDGNGQAEEEMLGTVLAGMPAHAKQKLNPYAAQTSHINRYSPVKKEQDIRYRHVTPGYNPNYKVHYAQQKTGIAHAAVYSKPIAYGPQYETRHAYTTEGKYNYEKPKLPNYTQYPVAAVEPIYAAPQTGPSGLSSYGSDASNSVVYGVKPSSETDFKPVYPFEGQFFSDTTSSPVTYSPTSMYLGSNDEENQEEDTKLEDSSVTSEGGENKFVVGNVPKELSDSATPAVVPEHGPRKLRKKRSISGSLEELLAEKELNKDIFISNEIDDVYNPNPVRNLAPSEPIDVTVLPKDITTVYAVSEPNKDTKTEAHTTEKVEVVESVSTIPINNNRGEKTTEAEMPVELETTTKSFKVYEVFPSSNTDSERNSPLYTQTTTFKSIMTETTTELKSETTSTMPTAEASTGKPVSLPTNTPDVITYPPINEHGGFFSFLQRIVDFKLRLGLGILQSTVDALNRLKDDTMQKAAKASH
ncbi:uncharacterized protein LOC142977074 [Anticarsia gemmatalis]|uniref:uncharacterized protein LOC142977074 n=1 Tax=Anticarsia gemmatalis TaxID=129554 RepID=UPI003F76566B